MLIFVIELQEKSKIIWKDSYYMSDYPILKKFGFKMSKS